MVENEFEIFKSGSFDNDFFVRNFDIKLKQAIVKFTSLMKLKMSKELQKIKILFISPSSGQKMRSKKENLATLVLFFLTRIGVDKKLDISFR